MHEVYVPFLLILMSWNRADPVASMEVTQHLYLDQRTCLAAGRQAERRWQQQRSDGRNFTWRCVEHVPHIEVFEPEKAGE